MVAVAVGQVDYALGVDVVVVDPVEHWLERCTAAALGLDVNRKVVRCVLVNTLDVCVTVNHVDNLWAARVEYAVDVPVEHGDVVVV